MNVVACTEQRHGAAILAILNDAIVNSTAIYDYESRKPQTMNPWFQKKRAAGFPVIGAENDRGKLLGFSTYGTFRDWPAYKYTVEHSVYVHREHRKAGVGRRLMEELIAHARQEGLHMMIGGIDIENRASITLHEQLGFVHAGTIRQAAFKFGRWLDLGFYQRIFESPASPIDG
jgi:L-amino acid N-acyltransferase